MKESLFSILHNSEVPFIITRSGINVGLFGGVMYSIMASDDGKFNDDRMSICHNPPGFLEYEMSKEDIKEFKKHIKNYCIIYSDKFGTIYEKKSINFKEYYFKQIKSKNVSRWTRYLKEMA